MIEQPQIATVAVDYEYPIPSLELTELHLRLAVSVMGWQLVTRMGDITYNDPRPHVYRDKHHGALKGLPFAFPEREDKGTPYDRSFQLWAPYYDRCGCRAARGPARPGLALCALRGPRHRRRREPLELPADPRRHQRLSLRQRSHAGGRADPGREAGGREARRGATMTTPPRDLLPKPTHAFIARKPCGCLSLVASDLPVMRAEAAESVARAVMAGHIPGYVTHDEAHALPWRCDTCKAAALAPDAPPAPYPRAAGLSCGRAGPG